ncbi:NADH dehydrogenase [ubiquinone] 1 alpha subcomplex subunit 13-like [Daphnia pulex]|uniref:NADH dehydrogenase [ubiquinone] 1 alpha subcomplex subunit 13-like n=1 Tax=Daphnia pulex TaxID=6669 RepID=UPI001EE045ED|nr:NADH dehydrogenase [ubiquinone] 1 alpha subcomplex subunit 13-like [Daphnia pulex]
MDATIKQDLPPPGGYEKIQYARNPAKTFFRGGRLLAGFIILNGCTTYYYFNHLYPGILHRRVEKKGSHLATLPLLLAEQDRAFLKHCRALRDEEEKLMANVPGWEVGKWNGQPIFKTLDKDVFSNPILSEYYCHAPYMDFYKKAMEEAIQV